jgi:phosphate transport system substrate-binding protein
MRATSGRSRNEKTIRVQERHLQVFVGDVEGGLRGFPQNGRGARLVAVFVALLARRRACGRAIGEAGRVARQAARSVAKLFLACVLLSAGASALADTLTAGGTGSSGPLLKLLFDDFARTEPGNTLRIISPPLGSGGASKALRGGRIDLAVIAYKPAEDLLGKSSLWFHLADTPFVMVTNDHGELHDLSIDDLAKIYAREITKWKSGTPIRLVLRASFDTDTKLLKSMSPAMAKAVDDAAKHSGMPTATDDLETLDMLTEIQGSLGPISLGHLRTTRSSLQIVHIGGVQPSLASLADGRYPWRKSLYVVLPEQPSVLAAKFAAYLRSKRGEAMLGRYGYLRGAAP